MKASFSCVKLQRVGCYTSHNPIPQTERIQCTGFRVRGILGEWDYSNLKNNIYLIPIHIITYYIYIYVWGYHIHLISLGDHQILIFPFETLSWGLSQRPGAAEAANGATAAEDAESGIGGRHRRRRRKGWGWRIGGFHKGSPIAGGFLVEGPI